MTKHFEEHCGPVADSLRVKFEDGSVWDIPLTAIIKDRADYYTLEFGGDFDEAYKVTKELFESNSYEALDWASNNMDWKDVLPQAQQRNAPPPANYAGEWVNAYKEIL